MHLLKAIPTLMAMFSMASSTRYCKCRASSIGRTFTGINQVCRGTSSAWCTTNCDIVGTNCDYCEYIPKGYPDVNSKDYSDIEYWCGQQSATDPATGKSFSGSLECYSNPISCSTCTGCKYYHNDGILAGFEKADSGQNLLNAHRGPQVPAVILTPLKTGVGYECTKLSAHAAVTMAQKLADTFKACDMKQIDTDRFEVDCNPQPKGARCKAGELNDLAESFNTLCFDSNGAAFDITAVHYK